MGQSMALRALSGRSGILADHGLLGCHVAFGGGLDCGLRPVWVRKSALFVSAEASQQQFGIGFRRFEIAQQRFQGVADWELGELTAKIDHLDELVRVVEAVVVAGA